jgi:antitoxin ParD1/3/4
MEITLTPEQEKFIAQAVASGLYTSPDEVIGASLSQLEEEESWKAYAKEKIAKGLQDLAAGRVITSDELLRRVSARHQKEA